MTYASLKRALGARDLAEQEAARQAYQTAYERGEQVLPWGLKTFLDGLPRLTSAGEAVNELVKLRGDMHAVYERAPGAIPAIVELVVREMKLSPQAVAAALGLPPLPHDALDVVLLTVVHGLAGEARNGLLPLSRIVAEVNAGCALNEGLTHKFISGRLHALGCVFTSHHPVSVILIPRLLPPMLDATLTRLLPSPEEPRAHEHTENGSRTQ